MAGPSQPVGESGAVGGEEEPKSTSPTEFSALLPDGKEKTPEAKTSQRGAR